MLGVATRARQHMDSKTMLEVQQRPILTALHQAMAVSYSPPQFIVGHHQDQSRYPWTPRSINWPIRPFLFNLVFNYTIYNSSQRLALKLPLKLNSSSNDFLLILTRQNAQNSKCDNTIYGKVWIFFSPIIEVRSDFAAFIKQRLTVRIGIIMEYSTSEKCEHWSMTLTSKELAG